MPPKLEALVDSLSDKIEKLQGSRADTVAFGHLEDRIVKHTFRSLAEGERALVRILTRKPIIPADEEVQVNPRARSAKLRAAERVSTSA